MPNSKEDLLRSLSVDTKVDEETFKVENEQKLAESVFAESMGGFKRKTAKIAETAFPVIKKVYEEQGDRYENVAIPITDGQQVYNIPVNLKAAYESDGKEIESV